jgi:hypothetical protein
MGVRVGVGIKVGVGEEVGGIGVAGMILGSDTPVDVQAAIPMSNTSKNMGRYLLV